MTVMTNTEPRFADSKLVEIAKPKVETKTLILPQGKKKNGYSFAIPLFLQ